MSEVTPFPHYNDLHDNRFTGLELKEKDFKLNSTFDVTKKRDLDNPRKGVPPEYDVPLRRFNFLNQKLREFPVKEIPGNIQLIDFGDGFGKTYAYKWKNRDSIVGYYMQFDDDSKIQIIGSKINSGTSLFAKYGSIIVNDSKLENCTIYAEGPLSIISCNLKNCYIFGDGILSGIQAEARARFIGTGLDLNGLTIMAPTLFFNPKELNQEKIAIRGCSFSSSCDLIGGVDIEGCKFNGPTRIQGSCTIKGTNFLGSTQIFSKGISIKDSNFMAGSSAFLTNSCKIKDCIIKDSPYIGGHASIEATNISGSPVILENAFIKDAIIKGGIIIQNSSVISGKVYDKAFITGSSIIKQEVSGNGVVAGSGTMCKGKVRGLLLNGVTCTHTVPEGQTHWDNRSCVVTQKNKLIDERNDNNSPGKSEADQSAPPSIE